MALVAFMSTPAWAIEGGSNAAPGEFPSVVEIERRSSETWDFSCTGAYLGNGAVLTAAHCVDGLLPTTLRVMGGSISRSDLSAAQIIDVVGYQVHENYLIGTGEYPNDIAILYLASSFDSRCPSAPLPHQQWPVPTPQPPTPDPLAGESCSVVGWGPTSTSNVASDILQQGTMTALSTASADYRFRRWPPPGCPQCSVDNQELALYDTRQTVTMTRFDGPVFCKSNGVTVLAGIQSWGVVNSSGRALASYPTVATRVSAYLGWIGANMP
jgi:hypothetical protein